jgi:hypothetical protein
MVIKRGVTIMNNAKRAALFGILFIILVLFGGVTRTYPLIFLGFVSLLITWYFAVKNSDDFNDKSNEYFIKTLDDNSFIPDKKVFSYDKLSGLAISEDLKQIAIVSRRSVNDEYSIKIIPFKDIIEAKVISNKHTITSTSLSSVATRGIVGGMLAGGVGSIIGGSTAKQKSSRKVKELTLEIVVNDLINPRYVIPFYKSELSIVASNPAANLIEEWYRTFSVIIDRNSKEARSV